MQNRFRTRRGVRLRVVSGGERLVLLAPEGTTVRCWTREDWPDLSDSEYMELPDIVKVPIIDGAPNGDRVQLPLPVAVEMARQHRYGLRLE